MNLMTD